MQKYIALLLVIVSSSTYTILDEESLNARLLEVQKTKKIIQLLLQDDQGSLSMLPSDVKKHIAGYMIDLEPWLKSK